MSEPNGHGKYAAPDDETGDARFPLPGSSHLGAEESSAPVRWEKLHRCAFLLRSKAGPSILGRAFAARVLAAHPLDLSLFPPHLPQAGEGGQGLAARVSH